MSSPFVLTFNTTEDPFSSLSESVNSIEFRAYQFDLSQEESQPSTQNNQDTTDSTPDS